MRLKNKSSKKLIISIFFSVLFLAGCATKITATFERPAELDLRGANKIAVLQFQTSDKVSYRDYHISHGGRIETIAVFITDLFRPSPIEEVQNEISSYLTRQLTSKLSESNYFTLIHADVILAAINNGNKIPTDVYLSGRIESLKSRIDEEKTKIQTKKSTGEITTEIKWSYTKKVDATISYSVISASDNSIIATRSKQIHRISSSKSRRKDLPNEFDLIKSDLDSLILQIMRELKPYTVTKQFKLLKAKNNDQMDMANQFAKVGEFDDAYVIYKEIYDTTGLFEAGYNEAQMLFVQNKLYDAQALMQQLVNKTGDSRAFYSLDQIKSEIRYAEKVDYQKELREKNANQEESQSYIEDAK